MMDKNSAEMINILVADPQISRRGIVNCLKSSSLNCDEAESGEHAIRILEAKKYHIVLLDRRLPFIGGLETSKIIRKRFPSTKIIALSGIGLDDKNEIISMMEMGVYGYLFKEINDQELINAINSVLIGKQYFSEDIRLLWKSYENNKKEFINSNAHHEELSKRERQIVFMICYQFTNSQIAEKLCISEATVKTHRMHIMKKLNAINMMGIAIYAFKTGLFKL